MHDLFVDAALVAITCAYARWLDESKDLEPDFVWLEVVAGTMLCLAHAHAMEVGNTPSCDRQPTEPGILWLWSTLLRSAA